MLRSAVSLCLLALVGIAGSCATAGGDDDEMLPPVSADASTQFGADAGSTVADAMTADAEPVSTPDSGIPGGGFCDGNEDCGAPGECCVIALCTGGTEIGDICIPD